MANDHSSQKDEDDVVEMKKALATGSASSSSNVASSGMYHRLIFLLRGWLSIVTALSSRSHCMLLHGLHLDDGREQGE